MLLKKGIFSLACLLLAAGNAQSDIAITQLANEGVIISGGESRVMIDGMVVDSYSVYGGLPEAAYALFSKVEGPYSGIDLALVSHLHHDHNQPKYACEFMKKSEATILVTSSQVLDLMRERCRTLVTTSPRIRLISPQYDAPEIFEVDGAKVTVFLLSHGTRKYAKIQNYGQLIEIGGMKVLHIGDAAMTPEDFQTAGLDQVEIDVALIPFWYFQPGPGSALVEQFLDAPVKIAVHIPPSEMEEVKAHLSEYFPAVSVLEQPLKRIDISSAAQ